MTRTQRLILVAALACVATVLPARSSHGQYGQVTAYGTWQGIEDFSITFLDQFDNPVGGYTESVPTTLTVEFFANNNATVTSPVGFPYGFRPQPYVVATLGPTGASGSAFAGGYAGFDGNFDLTYAGILPDGQIDTFGGFAVADFSASLAPSAGIGQPYFYFASFQGAGQALPEPAALAQVAIGVAVIAAFIGIRSYRARRARARTAAAGAPLDAQLAEPGIPAASGPGC